MKKNPPIETVLVFVCLGIVCFFFFEERSLLFAALGIGVAGLLSKRFSQGLHRAWASLSEKMGAIMSGLLLGLIFFVILSPLAFLFRRLSKESPFHIPKEEKSTFSSRNHVFRQEDLKNPW